jgi:hypothetical protein
MTESPLLRPVPSVVSVLKLPDAAVIATPSIMRIAPARDASSVSIAVRLVASVYGCDQTWNHRSAGGEQVRQRRVRRAGHDRAHRRDRERDAGRQRVRVAVVERMS